LSTLTKTLIVLLTVSAIFLCGIVVTYIANADNYRQKHDALRAEKVSLGKKAEDLGRQLNDKIKASEQRENSLNGQITSQKTELSKLRGDLTSAEREKSALLQKVNSWTSVIEGFTQTNDKQGELLRQKIEEIKTAQMELIRERKEHKETTAALVEKMAIIDALQAEARRLREEQTELQSRLDQLLLPVGKVAAPAVPVTPWPGLARPVPVYGRDIALSGLVTAIDVRNSMASVSVGAVDGVREGMKFHVTRGDEFICDILIIDVDTEEAVGVLELVQQQLRVGDNASTNL